MKSSIKAVLFILCSTLLLAGNGLSKQDKNDILALFTAYQTNVLNLKTQKAKSLFVTTNTPITGVYQRGGELHTAKSRMELYTDMKRMGDPIDVQVFNSTFISDKNIALTFGEYKTLIKGEVKYTGKNMWAFTKENGKWKIASIAYIPFMGAPRGPQFKANKSDILTFVNDYLFALNSKRSTLVKMFTRSSELDIYNGKGFYLSPTDEKIKSSTKLISASEKVNYERKFSSISIEIHNDLTASVVCKYQLFNKSKVVSEGTEILGLVVLNNEWKINSVLWN